MAKTTFLDFEAPIAELEAKIEELRLVQDDSADDISEEIERLQGLRGMYGIESPAPLCTDPATVDLSGEQALCQMLEAPSSLTERLVPDVSGMLQKASRDGEIRLTYRELTALIEDAVRQLK